MREVNLGLLHGLKANDAADKELTRKVEEALLGESTESLVARELRAGLQSFIGHSIDPVTMTTKIEELLKEVLPSIGPPQIQAELDPDDPMTVHVKVETPLIHPIMVRMNL